MSLEIRQLTVNSTVKGEKSESSKKDAKGGGKENSEDIQLTLTENDRLQLLNDLKDEVLRECEKTIKTYIDQQRER